ncbi:MAG: hypothetical protein V3U14_12805 [candidate division NC10 bacterium]
MSLFNPRKRPPAEQQTFGSDDDAASLVRTRYQEGAKNLIGEARDYWLNHAFLHGHQWLYFSNEDQTLDEIHRDKKRVQATVNRLWPTTRTIMGQLMQRPLVFEVPPTDVSDTHIRGAKLSESLLRVLHNEHMWERTRESFNYAIWKGGTAALTTYWDEHAHPILEEAAPGESPISEGDTVEEHLNITQFVVEPGTRNPEFARWWIKAVAYPPDEVKARFQLKETPPADASAGMTPFQRKLISYDRWTSTETELTTVFTMYERPNHETPKGRVVVVVGDESIHDDEWPYPFKHRLNLVVGVETPKENRWTGDSVFTMARPVQVLLNVSWSSIAEHMKLAGNARLLLPMTTIDLQETITDLPGEVIPYNDALATKPAYLTPPQMPAWWMNMPDQLADQIDDILGSHDVSRGDAPPNIESGFGIQLLKESDSTPTTRMSKEVAGCFSRLATMVLEITEQEASKTKIDRKSVVQTPGQAAITINWNGEDMNGQTTAFVPEDAIIPRSRAAQMELAKDMLAVGMITSIGEFMAVAELPGQRDILAAVAPDIQKAREENALFGHGRQSIPRDFDDHQIHISEHNRYRKSVDYRLLSEEDQELIQKHIDAHVSLAAEELGRGRAAGAIDPALATAPNATDAPFVDPVSTPTGPGGPGPVGPGAVPLPPEGPIDPGQVSDDVLAQLNQLGGV